MLKILLVVLALLSLAGCADQVVCVTTEESVGFLHGFWHGFIMPISFIVSLFDETVAIYAVYNSGGWYDLGYFLGLGGLPGISYVK